MPSSVYLGEFEKYYTDYYSSVLGFLVNRVGNEAEDLAQEVFTRICKGRFDLSKGPAFAFTVARNLAIDYYRKMGRTPPVQSLEDVDYRSGTKPTLVEDTAELNQIKTEVRELSRDGFIRGGTQHKVFEMLEEGKTQEEIMKELNISDGSFRVAKHRILKKLASVVNL